MEMDEDVRAFGTTLGTRALAGDWSGVHAMLAPWLRATWATADVQRFFEDEYRKALEEWQIGGDHRPEHPEPEIGGNHYVNATELRKPLPFTHALRDVAPEVTDDNVRYWLRMQLQCSDDQRETLGFDFFCEVWMAVCDTDEGLRVGYWSQGAY